MTEQARRVSFRRLKRPLAYPVLASPSLPMTPSTGPFDPILGRLDQLAGRYVPLLLGLEPLEVSRLIDRLLADIGEAIGAGQISFAAAGASASRLDALIVR